MASDSDPPRRAGADGTPRDGRRVIPLRRALPGRRAVVGGLLVTVAGLAAHLATADSSPTLERWVVASRDLPPGHMLEAGDLATLAADIPPSLASRAFSSPDALVGSVLTGPLRGDELVQAGAIAAVDEARVPTFSIELPEADAHGGDLQRGDVVAVVATYGTGSTAETSTLSQAALVVDVRTTDRVLGTGAPVLLRMAVRSPTERLAIVNATVAGRVALVRVTGAPEDDLLPLRIVAPSTLAAPSTSEPESGSHRMTDGPDEASSGGGDVER